MKCPYFTVCPHFTGMLFTGFIVLLFPCFADVLHQAGRPRPLAFDPNLHKILNSELKHLYTAVTRARANVWIFDQGEEKRAPMFEYFKARKLVKFVSMKDSEKGEGERGR
jgi:hypothetical protein